MKEIIYLDNNATTKIDPRVLDAMMPYLTDQYANASSSHFLGRKINEAIKVARAKIADLIGSKASEITFTSGATESINIALKGIANAYKNKGKHIVTLSTEHSAVLDTCKFLETIGYDITYLPVKGDGLVDLEILKENLRSDTVLVCIMYVNNETGVIQPIEAIAKIVHVNGSLFMSDATQAVGKIPINVNELEVDILCFSAHKFYGPKGVGGLYVSSGSNEKIRITEQSHGGKQEKGLRSGTLNVSGIIGLGEAAYIAQGELHADQERIKKLRDYFENELLKLDNTSVNGNRTERLYNVTNISFKGIDSESIIEELENIMVSNGSACSSALVEASHVLLAMGKNNDAAFSSVRFSLGRFSTKQEIDIALTSIKKLIASKVASA